MTKTDSGYRSMEVSTKCFISSMSQGTLDEHILPSDLSAVAKISELSSQEEDKLGEDAGPQSLANTEPTEVPEAKIRVPQIDRSLRMRHSICAEPSFMEVQSSAGLFLEPSECTALAVGRKRRDTDTSHESSGNKRTVSLRQRARRKYSINQLRVLQRDYSIDEKSDRLFREFSSNESGYQADSWTNTVPRRERRNRRHCRMDLGDTSPRAHRRKISPQDSIEEESPFDGGTRETSFIVSTRFNLDEPLWETCLLTPTSFINSLYTVNAHYFISLVIGSYISLVVSWFRFPYQSCLCRPQIALNSCAVPA